MAVSRLARRLLCVSSVSRQPSVASHVIAGPGARTRDLELDDGRSRQTALQERKGDKENINRCAPQTAEPAAKEPDRVLVDGIRPRVQSRDPGP